jgi:hypothetical protein
LLLFLQKKKSLPFLLMLSACGTLPQPFYGNPGAEGAKLATPPPPILIVPKPGQALLGDDAAKLYAADLAAAFVALDVPSIAGPAGSTDWRLVTTASLHGNEVIPAYRVLGPDGKTYGRQNGAPADAAGWANGNAEVLQKAAGTDALALCKLLGDINARVQGSNPESLENRPARVYLAGVTGAPTDGDNALALDIGRDLPGANIGMVDNPAQADFVVSGAVKAQADQHRQILVELVWTVRDSNHRVIGAVTQLHDLNPADITPYWGDVAAAAAAEGASGVQQVITNATLHRSAD